MKPNKYLFPAITFLIMFSIVADLYLLPLKQEKAIVYDTEAETVAARRSYQNYYIIPQAQHKFSVRYQCYDYLSKGDSITVFQSLLFSKTLSVSFQRDGQTLNFKAGMTNVLFLPVAGFIFILFAAGIILWIINKFPYQKQRLLDMSFFMSVVLLIFYYLVY